MNRVVPRWALAALLGISVCSIVAGFVSEQTAWALEHPFTINLLSSLGGFGASLVFASIVLNRITRRQYWSAELDRRTRAAITLDHARRDLTRFFDLSQRLPLIDQLRDRTGPPTTPDADPGGEASWATRPEAYSDLKAHVANAVILEQRLSFVADGELIYRCDRLARKWAAFSEVCNQQLTAVGVQQPSEVLISTGIELASALDSLSKWILHAPDRPMKAAVQQHIFRSDLD